MTARSVAAPVALLALALVACRQRDPASCPPSADCESCTSSGCEYCVEDTECIPAGETCDGPRARVPGDCDQTIVDPVDGGDGASVPAAEDGGAVAVEDDVDRLGGQLVVGPE
jgi:hypothetical protein